MWLAFLLTMAVGPPACVTPYQKATIVQQAPALFPETDRERRNVIASVRVTVGPAGNVMSAEVAQSSGDASLDKAAINAARRTVYAPKVVNCEPVMGERLVRITLDPAIAAPVPYPQNCLYGSPSTPTPQPTGYFSKQQIVSRLRLRPGDAVTGKFISGPIPGYSKPMPRFLHTSIFVNDMKETIDFYTEKLGMRLLDGPYHYPGNADMAFVGNDWNAYIELVYDLEEHPPYQLGNRYEHLALEVEGDLKPYVDGLRVKGVKILKDVYKSPGGTRAIAFIEDPNGIPVELLEPRRTQSLS